MRKLVHTLVAAAVAALALPALAAAGEHRLGFGYHYWTTLDDIEIDDLDEVDDNGQAAVVSYQYLPGGLIKFEVDVEYFDEGFGGSTDTAYTPQVFVLLGGNIYGGVGVGATKSDGFADGDDWSDLFYAARVGVEILLLPRIHLDINANYRTGAFDELDEAETDALTLGAAVRVSF